MHQKRKYYVKGKENGKNNEGFDNLHIIYTYVYVMAKIWQVK